MNCLDGSFSLRLQILGLYLINYLMNFKLFKIFFLRLLLFYYCLYYLFSLFI